MIIDSDKLIESIDKILTNKSVVNNLKLKNNPYYVLYEGYVFSLVLKAIDELDVDFNILGETSKSDFNEVIFRGSPGKMHSQSKDFTYVEFSLNEKKFELHLGVIYLGESEALHEIDVSIYEKEKEIVTEDFERNKIPTQEKLKAAIECKCYKNSLGVVLGRTFVGLVDDFNELKIKAFVSNSRSNSEKGKNGLIDYFSPKERPNCFLEISPYNKEKKEREFIDFIKNKLKGTGSESF